MPDKSCSPNCVVAWCDLEEYAKQTKLYGYRSDNDAIDRFLKHAKASTAPVAPAPGVAEIVRELDFIVKANRLYENGTNDFPTYATVQTLTCAIAALQRSSAVTAELLQDARDFAKLSDRDKARAIAAEARLAAAEARWVAVHDLVHKARELVRLELDADKRPAGLFQSLQDAVYAIRGREALTEGETVGEWTTRVHGWPPHNGPVGGTLTPQEVK